MRHAGASARARGRKAGVLTGRQRGAVRRLRMDGPPPQLDDLVSDEANFHRYRVFFGEVQAQQKQRPFLPFLGLLLRDLTFLDDGNPTLLRPNVYNFSKLRRIAEPVLLMHTLSQLKYTFPEPRGNALALRALLYRTCCRASGRGGGGRERASVGA